MIKLHRSGIKVARLKTSKNKWGVKYHWLNGQLTPIEVISLGFDASFTDRVVLYIDVLVYFIETLLERVYKK